MIMLYIVENVEDIGIKTNEIVLKDLIEKNNVHFLYFIGMCSISKLKKFNFATIEISTDFLVEAKNFKTEDQRMRLRQIFLEKKPVTSLVLVAFEKL